MPLTLLTLAAALVAGTPLPIDAALLHGLPLADATLNAHGEVHHCAGPTVASLLAKLGLPQGEQLGGPALANGVLFRASDGYAVLFSLGELNSTLGNETAIIAVSCEGKPLDGKTGPYRVMLPGDHRPARAMRQVISLELVVPLNSPQARRRH